MIVIEFYPVFVIIVESRVEEVGYFKKMIKFRILQMKIEHIWYGEYCNDYSNVDTFVKRLRAIHWSLEASWTQLNDFLNWWDNCCPTAVDFSKRSLSRKKSPVQGGKKYFAPKQRRGCSPFWLVLSAVRPSWCGERMTRIMSTKLAIKNTLVDWLW